MKVGVCLYSVIYVAGKCSSDAIHWNFTYDGWKVLAAEVNLLLSQISYGAGIPLHATLFKLQLNSAMSHFINCLRFIESQFILFNQIRLNKVFFNRGVHLLCSE